MDITSTLLAAASAGGTQPGVTWTSNTPSPAPVVYWRDSATSGLVTLLLGTGNTISYSTDTVNFSLYTITPSNPSVTITGVSYVNSQFVAFGSLGYIAVSSDGLTWTEKTAPVSATLNGVAGDGTNMVTFSGFFSYKTADNGTSWTTGTTIGPATVQNTARSLVYASSLSLWVMSANMKAYSSTDGLAWTDRGNLGVSNNTLSIAWSGSRFVGVSSNTSSSTYYVYTSTNGTTWTLVGSSTSPSNMRYVSWDGSRFVFRSSFSFYESASGTSMPTFVGTAPYNFTCLRNTVSQFNLSVVGSTYVLPGVAGSGFPQYPAAYTSTTLATGGFTATYYPSIPPFFQATDAAYFNSLYLLAGPSLYGTTNILAYSSSNKTTWTAGNGLSGTSATSTSNIRFVQSPSALLAFSTDGTCAPARTTDGTTWTNPSGVSSSNAAIAWDGSNFLTINLATSDVKSSSDGSTWTTVSASGPFTGSVGYLVSDGASLYYYKSDSSAMAKSSDGGVTWIYFTPTNLPASGLTDVIYANGLFLACGTNPSTVTNCVAYSTDGVSFTQVDAKVSVASNLYYNGFNFVVVSQTTGIATSADGINWVLRTSVTSPGGVVYANGAYLAGGSIGQTITS